ncbi:hypothetical protein ACWEN6_24995 [Sphaerisporangium sp. NPDC004334]
MGWTASGLMGATQVDQWDPTALAIDLTAEDGKAAFWGSSITPNFNTDTAYNAAPWNSGQSSGAGYTAGGPTVTGTTLVASSGVMVYDYDNISIPNSTIIAEGYINYWPNKSNRIFLAVWFGAPLETQDGTFLVTNDPSGVARLDYTP